MTAEGLVILLLGIAVISLACACGILWLDVREARASMRKMQRRIGNDRAYMRWLEKR